MEGVAMQRDFDVLIVGAGLSGIGAARYLKVKCPEKSFAVLESKPEMGGTWNLFRYPGIRSDSDMYTMGYAFKPWTNPKSISHGDIILNYIKETSAENGIDAHINYGRKVVSASYDSKNTRWTLEIDHNGTPETWTCNMLFGCSGYYMHDEGYLPEWEGYDDFEGTLVHPQFWPEDLDYAGKRIAIIGSGATAVTLLPSLAQKAAHVVQVQRSPTYIVNRPSEDKWANRFRRFLPAKLAYALSRWRIILDGRMRRQRMAKNIKGAKRFLVGEVAKEVGDAVDWKTHFVPEYWPGQQRICAVPDGDMFEPLKSGKASIHTGHIERFTKTGLQMQDGTHIDADIIITATGLKLHFLGGMQVSVDQQQIDPSKLLIFKGFMYSNVPNLIYFSGYTNASWTLKVDLVAEFACRLLRHMDRIGARQVVPVASAEDLTQTSESIKFTSGYFLRSLKDLPKHGKAFPWIHEQDYLWDRKTLKRGKVDDGALTFSKGDPMILPQEQVRREAAEIAAQ